MATTVSPARPVPISAPPGTLSQRLKYFVNPLDGRYEDLFQGDWRLKVFRDLAAGLVVAMIAIPLAMGFAMASGLRPEQGIVGGAVAGFGSCRAARRCGRGYGRGA